MSKEYAERKAKEKQRQSAKKSTSATKPASAKKSAGVGGAIAKGIRTVSKQVQSTQQKAYDQILGEDVVNVVEGAARKSALDSYISAYGNLGGYDPNGAMTFGQAQSYLAALENARAATKGGVSARAFLPKTPKELNDFLGNYKALGGEADRIRAALAKGEKAYNAEYYYPRKYNGSDAAKINQAMAKLRFDGDAGKDELAWLKENQYNYWTSDQIKKGIADTQRQIEEQKKRKRNNLILEDQLKRMQDAAYTVATRDWSAQDLKDMARYASIYERRDNADLAEAFAQSGASAQARSYEKELGSLYKKFKGMGYSDEEISALRTYFLQIQHAMERARDLRELSEFSKDHKVLASIASVPMNMMSGIGYADLALKNLTAGTDPITGAKKRVDQYAPLTAMSDAATTMRGAVSEDMSGLGRFLYNTGMSIVDSRMAMGSGAWLGEALLGGAAAMQATRNAYQRGATDAQALAVGAWAGASESLFEHISLDRLRIMQTSSAAARRTAKQFLIDLAKQAGVEGSEEAFTTLSNTLGDAIIMRDKSELNSAIRAYMANGEGREAATRKAWSDWFGQLALDFAGGALSGGVNGAASMGIGTMQRNAQNAAVGQRVNENGYADDLIEQAASLPDGGEALALAQRLQGMQSGRKANRTAGELYSAVQSGELQQRVQGRLEELGLTENAAETASAIVRSLNGQQLSGKQSRLLDGRQAQRVIFEYEHAQRGMRDPAAWTQEHSARSGERAKAMLSTNGGRVKQFAAQFGDQAKAVERVYRKGQDAEDFATSFEAAYEIGRGGGKLDAAQKHNATRALEPEQVEIAWALGKEAAKSGVSDGRIATPSVTARNDMNGGKTNGTEVHLRRGGERADGARTLGLVRSLEPKAKRAEKGKSAESRPADSQALEVTVGEKISALRLGVENGAVAQTAYTVTGNETESMKKARALGEERGMKVVFFAGGNLGVHTRTDKTGYVASARSLVQGDTVYVRADHEQFTAEQLMQHELGHEAIKNGEIDLAEVRERIRTEFGEEQFDDIVQLYLDAYAETGMTADEIWEEIVCDSLGDMNIFSDSFEALERKPAELLHAAQRAANESRGEKREQEGRAPPEAVQAKFSREYDPETASIKEQIRNSEEELNRMAPVANLTVPQKFSSKRDAAKWAIRLLKRTGYQVDRQGYGVIRFNENDINYGVNYADTIGEQAAFAALPNVLKRGIEIGRHSNHKTRKKKTVTFAAPVVLNGTRGNMAVVVNMINDHYYSHRILLPDSTAFVFSENKNDAAQEPHRGVTDNGSLADATSAASNNSISDSAGKSNPKTSLDLAGMKLLQYETIRDNHPADAIDKVWIRSADDVKTFNEVSGEIDDGENPTPDYTYEMVQKALESGYITVYSSNRIRTGTFVTPSKMEAQNYSADGNVNQMRVPVEHVAWIDIFEGQYTGDVLSESSGKQHFSHDLESLAELRRENRELRERAAKWRRETQRTKAPELRREDVRRAAKGLISEMQSTMKAGEIEDDLRELGEYLMRGEGRNERAPSWAEVKERAGAIAEKLVDSAEALSEGSDPELYEDMKRYVRETKMTIADRDKGDIPNGYEYFRRKNVGILRLGNDGLPVDEAYEHLQGAFGEGYFPADITHPADQLMRIADVINGLKPAFENPYSYRRAEAVEWASNAIIDTLLSEDVRQTAPTFADRQAAKYDAYVARSQAAIRRVREQRDRQIARVKQEHRAQKERARERKTRSEMWRGILALKQDFQRMAEKPEKGNSRHAPMGLAIALRNLTDCFDRERGSREGSVKLPEFKESLVRLRDEYEAMKNDSVLSFYYDPVVMEQLAAVNVELRNVTDPTAMSTKQLAQIYDVLRMCKHSITTANRFIAMEYEKGITDAGRQWGHEVMHATPLLKGVTGQLLNYQLRPDSFFARLSGFAKNSIGEQVQQMFVDGTEKMLRIQQDFYYSLEDFSTDKRFDALTKRGDKALVDVGLKDMDGNTVKLTRDQMLSVYMHLRAEDNLRAAAYGGLDVPNAKAYYTGNVAESFDKSVRTSCIDAAAIDLVREQRELERLAREDDARGEVRPEVAARLEEVQAELQAMEGEMIGTLLDVRAEIEKQMTEFEKELVAAADAWMRKSADYINAETMAMYGIEKANVEHYWTIHRNTNFVNTDMRTAVEEINLENWGSLKERVRSHAPVKLTGFIFELDNHTKKMSQFCGFAAVQRDFNKLYNTRLPGQHTSLSEQVHRKFGSGEKKLGVSGQEYIDNYIKAISGGEHVKPSPIAWVRRNLPRATLSANFRVALSQVASVPTAAAEVGWGAMAKGWARYSVKGLSAKQQEQLAKTDPWFWQRSRGEGGMREFAEMKESTFAFDRAYNKVAGTKAGKALLNWCQRFDMYATYTQWAMAEEWVKSNRKDLQKGSDAFNEAVSRKYRDIIRKTQPNYTTTERSDLLRDSRESMKWATMYKTQSNQNLNILYEATARLRQFTRDYKNGANGVTAADLKQARAEFANAYTGVILGGTVTFVLFRAAANALMHCMNAYRDDDDELTLESFLNGIWQETLGAMAGMFLLGSEIEEYIMSFVTHKKYWGLSDSAISSLSKALEYGKNLSDKISDGKAEWEDYRKVIFSFMAPLGVPGENVMKIINGIRYHIEDIQNGEFLSFEAGVDRTTKQQVNRFFAAIASGDKQKAQRIYDEMIEAKSGSKDPEGSVQSALRARIKSAYLDEDGEAITESQALQLLKQYGGKSDEDAEKAVREWKFERDHGFKYDDLKAAYLSGEISDTAYVKARMEFGGKSKEEAEKDLRQAKVFKEYGVEYGEGSVVEAVLNGEISESDAYTIWRDYGGVSEKEAQSRADQLRFVVEHPETAYDDVKSYTVQSFYEYGEPAGIPAEDYMSYMAEIDNYHADVDANGNTISGSKKQKVVNYINTLPISNEQKTAMYLACGYAKSKIPAWT